MKYQINGIEAEFKKVIERMKPVAVKDKHALYMGFEGSWMLIVHQDGEEFYDGTPEFDAVFESVFPEYIY